MATIIPNTFTTYRFLTEDEEIGCHVLTIGNTQVIQNEIARLAQERLNISYDLNNTIHFVQQEAELKGRISSLQWLLDSSEIANRALAATAQTTQS